MSVLDRLTAAPGVYWGAGTTPGGGRFVARVAVQQHADETVTIDYEAWSAEGGLQHAESARLARTGEHVTLVATSNGGDDAMVFREGDPGVFGSMGAERVGLVVSTEAQRMTVAWWWTGRDGELREQSRAVLAPMRQIVVAPPVPGADRPEEPTSEEPTSEEPTSEEPTSEEPTSEEPTVTEADHEAALHTGAADEAADELEEDEPQPAAVHVLPAVSTSGATGATSPIGAPGAASTPASTSTPTSTSTPVIPRRRHDDERHAEPTAPAAAVSPPQSSEAPESTADDHGAIGEALEAAAAEHESDPTSDISVPWPGILVLHGASTGLVAQRLAARLTRAAVVRTDLFDRAVRGTAGRPDPALRHRIALSVVQGYAASGHPVILHGSSSRADHEQLVEAIAGSGLSPVQLVDVAEGEDYGEVARRLIESD